MREYNEERPHTFLGGIPPREFAENWNSEAPRRAGFLNLSMAQFLGETSSRNQV
jgi:hypothetical protein